MSEHKNEPARTFEGGSLLGTLSELWEVPIVKTFDELTLAVVGYQPDLAATMDELVDWAYARQGYKPEIKGDKE